jgi:stage III sporulation protein AG
LDQKRTAGNQRFQAKDRPFGIPVLKPEYLRLALLGALGLALIIAGSFMSGTGKGAEAEEGRLLSELREYQDALTKQLEQVVSAVQGAGKVHVSVTLERGPETVSRNTQSESTPQGQTRHTVNETETTQAVTGRGAGSGDSLIPETVLTPRISGCVVVAEGARDPVVKTNIYRAVQVLLGIPIYKIEVLPMQGGK